MNKTAIKNFAIWARNKLIADIVYQAGLLGVTEKGIAQPLPQSINEVQFFDIGTKDYMTVRGKTIRQRNAFVAAIKAKQADTDYASAFRFVVEKVAYTWFNRLIAIRFMEVNDYLPSRVRVLSSENPGKAEPDMVTRPFDTDLSFSAQEQDEIMRMKDENKLDELFRMLFIKQCQKLHEVLPGLFDPQGIERVDSYLELLLTISFTDKDGVLWHLVHDIPEDDFNVEKEGQVEIIGWMYQYYNTEPKDQVFANLKKNIKISKDNIPAATQLFTPDWIVRYMVENSLGRLWVEGHPNEELKKSWKYYLEEAEQEPQLQAQLTEIRKEYAALRPEEIKVIDPCMGSGHILVYLFDVLMQIYESQGWTQREAAQSIVQNNLYGLDIDDRAAQLAYFAVMMKARQYDRRFLERRIVPHIYGIQESNGINRDHIKLFGKGMNILEKNNAINRLNEILDVLRDAKEYGSILNVPELDWILLYRYVAGIDDSVQITLDSVGADETLVQVRSLVEQAQVIAQKYHVVVTNPPYMKQDSMPPLLAKYIEFSWENAKYDLYAAFMYRCCNMTVEIGYTAMITMHNFMFSPSFLELRNEFINTGWVNLLHLGSRAFSEISGEVVQTVSYILTKAAPKRNTSVIDVTDINSPDAKETLFQKTKENPIVFNMSNTAIIPWHAIGYGLTPIVLDYYRKGQTLEKHCVAKAGVVTGDDEFFCKFWYEVSISDITFNPLSKMLYKYVPFSRGGTFVGWYGNTHHVLRIRDMWDDTKTNKSVRRGDRDYYYRRGIGWSQMGGGTSKSYSVIEKSICKTTTPMLYPDNQSYNYILGYLNSPIPAKVLKSLNPTLSILISDILHLPYIQASNDTLTINGLVDKCIVIAREAYDQYELSWDFRCHPLVTPALDQHYMRLSDCWCVWEHVCDERFAQLKSNEEELNRIFIDIYGLQDELTPDVDDKDVTVRKADLGRDIRSLISYAVGCMLGRYSLDVPGLAYAGGTWESAKYSSYLPDLDNCIPLIDEPYFDDDIVGRFVEFIRTVYGADMLEENLTFIANALGSKGNTSREVIRNYFLNDFMNDHLKVYQKRPIYWLFDSGKQNGFKALVYVHRWNADTVGNLRVEYLHRMQRVYEKEIERMQDIIDNSRDNREVNQASKRREKLVKQLKEARDYDAKIAHVALSRVEIDLDDGVKVNYEKVQQGPDGKSLGILAKI